MEREMKQTLKIATIAVAVFAGIGGTAYANGTFREAPAPVIVPKVVTPPPAPTPPPPQPAPPAKAPSSAGPYISGAVGLGIPQNAEFDGVAYKMDNGIVYNGAIGYDFKPGRIELGVGYQAHDYTDFPQYGDISALTVMANGYYDFEASKDVFPYVMAGLGIADINTPDDYVNETVFAWQIGAGVGFKVAKDVTLDVGYRYLKPDDMTSVQNENVSWAGHNVMVGLRYQF
jgi:opacity protein-like surface antigen